MSDLENMQLNNAFPSALKKNRRRYTIAYKVSILEKLRSKTLLEIVKETNIPENTIRDWIVAEEKLLTTTKNKKNKSLGGQGGVGLSRKDFLKSCMYCILQILYVVFVLKCFKRCFNQSLELITIMLKL